MPTPGERKALLFVAALATLGVAARGYRALRAAGEGRADSSALARQIDAVDAAVAARAAPKTQPRRSRASADAKPQRGGEPRKPKPRTSSVGGTLERPSGGADAMGERRKPPDRALADGRALAEERRLAVERSNADARARVAERSAMLFPGRAAQGPGRSGVGAIRTAEPQPRHPVDLDTAPADEIATLPGIGPVLADRIVTDRTSNGPFGSLAALQRVKGIGPALARKLQGMAVFSRPRASPPVVLHLRKVRMGPPRP